MKTLFLTVPQWYPMNPYLSSAILVGQLKSAGFDAVSYDLNIEFFNDILKKEFVEKSAEKARAMLPELQKLYLSCDEPEKNFNEYDKKTKTALLRYRAISEFMNKEEHLIAETAEKTDDAVWVLKDKADFYNPEKLFKAKDVINDALRIISLPYEPSKIMIDNYIANPVMSFSFEDVKTQCFDKSQNMFVEYFEEKFSRIPMDDCELIGISVADLSQLIPALTLAAMIKRKTDKKICLGGNYIFKIINEIKENVGFFDVFCDFISVGDGEIAAIELAEYMDGRREIQDVHSLVWACDGTVKTNETAPLLNLNKLSYPDFDGYDFSKYFSPDIVLPVQLGKGCYWGKCAFCDFYTGQQKFDIKSIEHAADEVEHLVGRYGVKHFIFVDEAVPPVFYDKFATELLRRKLDIHFYSFARLDKGFTREVLENLKNAGAEFFSWGYEAHSQRLLELMNKGIDADVRDRIIDDCVDIGMWTQCTFLLGYPTETKEELESTIKVIKNRKRINSCTPSNFALKKNAILKNETEKVGITEFKSNGDFHISCSYELKESSMDEIKRNRMDFQRRFLKETEDCLWSLSFTDTDHLLLYLSRYGRDYVRDYRLKYKKKQYG